MDRKEFGKKGELKAVEFLKEKGFKIIETNYLKRAGEIDIIAFDPEWRIDIISIEWQNKIPKITHIQNIS